MAEIADQLVEEEMFGFSDFEPTVRRKIRKNKKANGVHKYMKTYLKLYNWQDRENLIKQYTNNKINPENNKPISKMKQRYNFIQADFNAFVAYLKNHIKKKK